MKQLDALYENAVLIRIMRLSYFQTASSSGPNHRDLWQYATIPAIAGVATAVSSEPADYHPLTISQPQVEKVLLEYKSGERKALKFAAKEFRNTYLSHIATLCEMWRANPARLEAYCRRIAEELL
jgi:hypothetical protein